MFTNAKGRGRLYYVTRPFCSYQNYYTCTTMSEKGSSRLPLSKFDIVDSCFTCSDQEKKSKEKLDKLRESFKTIIECVGEDPGREGLVKTPLRAAKALCFFTKGYEQTVKGINVYNNERLIIVD